MPVNDDERAQQQFAADMMIHLDHLYRVAFYLAKDRDEANDFVQETYLRALTSYQQFTPGTNLKAWLTKILYNFFFDYFKKSKRIIAVDEQANPEETGVDYWERTVGQEPDPEQLVLAGELKERINDALKKIPEEFRTPILLVDLGDLSYIQAAEILSCPIGTVRSRLSRGRKLLQKHLRGYAAASDG